MVSIVVISSIASFFLLPTFALLSDRVGRFERDGGVATISLNA
jgi:hypothetical protein